MEVRTFLDLLCHNLSFINWSHWLEKKLSSWGIVEHCVFLYPDLLIEYLKLLTPLKYETFHRNKVFNKRVKLYAKNQKCCPNVFYLKNLSFINTSVIRGTYFLLYIWQRSCNLVFTSRNWGYAIFFHSK